MGKNIGKQNTHKTERARRWTEKNMIVKKMMSEE